MKKTIRRTLLAVLTLALCFLLLIPALAATGLVLVGSFPSDAQMVEDVADAQGNYKQVLSVDDGAIMLTTIRQHIDKQYPMGMKLSSFLRTYFPNGHDLETLEVDPVAAYPTERASFLTGENEDTNVVEAVAIRTDECYFAFFAEVDADAYYGYTDGYQEGEVPTRIDNWVQSLDLYDPDVPDPCDVPYFSVDDVQTGVLYADFSCGSERADELGLIKQMDMAEGGELDALGLAQGLSEWTGLDFTIASVEPREDGVAVDWSRDSTLLAGLGDRAQKDEFHFYDAESLSWFMLDSLCRTIQANLGIENVYYSMDGGQDLKVPEISNWSEFPSDLPYMGSAFFHAHEDGRGDLIGDDQGGSELGYDDEAGYGQPYCGFVETTLLPGQRMELIQSTSDGQAIREGTAMDGAVVVTNCTFEPIYELDQLEETAAFWASLITSEQLIGGAPDEDISFYQFRLFEDADYSAMTSYPCYLASWYSGTNEDTRENLALIALMDSGSLMYRFSVSADQFEDVRAQLYGVLGGLTIDEMKD